MSHEAYVDPRESVSFEIEPGMVFFDTRPDEPREIRIEYADRDAGIIFVDTEGDAERDEVYMMDSYDAFESEVGSGRYEPKRDDDGDIVREGWMGRIHRLKSHYEAQDGRTADHKAEAIDEVLDQISEDVPADHNETVNFQTIEGIGGKAAESLRTNGFTTKGDVRTASKEQIESLPYMGPKNTERLLAEVAQ